MSWQKEIDELNYRRELANQMGGAERIAKQHSRGRLTVRDRIQLLLDPDSFQEVGTLAGRSEYDNKGHLISFTPDAYVIGYGKIQGRRVCFQGGDFTIHGGSSNAGDSVKEEFASKMALEWRIPFIRLLDQAGGSIRILENENEPLFRGSGYGVCLPVALMSQVPVVSAVLGSVAGLPAVWAAEAHWNIMTKNTSEVFVAGPPVVDRAFHLRTTKVELGGYKVQAYQSGVIDNVAEDEEDLFRQIRLFLSYLPENVWQQPPRVEGGDAPTRREEELLSIIPKDSKKVYDIRQLISHIVDKDSIFELSPFFGRSFVTILARMDGYPVAIMSNDCRWFGGAQTAAACEKMTRFVDLADTFHIPVVYLVDVPGFMIGVDSEKEGTLRKAARLWFAVHQATVPWVSVIIRRCYGVAGGVRNRRTGLNFTYAWPSSRRGPLPLEGGVMAAYRQEIETATDPEARRIEIEKRIERASSWARFAGTFDNTEVIDPRDTRPLLCQFVRDAWQVTATQLGPKLRGIRP